MLARLFLLLFIASTTQVVAQTIPAMFQPLTPAQSASALAVTDSGYKGTYLQLVDSMFRRLQATTSSLITSNTLVDRYIFSDYRAFNGTLSSANLQNSEGYRDLFNGLYWAQLNATGRVPRVELLDTTFFNYSGASLLLSATAWNYQRTDSLAFLDGRIAIQNMQAIDPPTRAGRNPYISGSYFSVGCHVDSVIGLSQTFELRPQFFYTNRTTTITSLRLRVVGEFDLPISLGSPLPVLFASAGRKNVILRIQYSNGEVREMQLRLKVGIAGALPRSIPSSTSPSYYRRYVSNGDKASFTLDITADRSFNNLPKAKAKVSVLLACGNTAIRKPFVFIEGFDPPALARIKGRPGSLIDFDKFLRQLEFYDNPVARNQDGVDLSAQLNENGYDLIFIDFANGADYIQNNAYLVWKVIEEINRMKSSTEKLMVVGASMGGLVGRVAIRYMELANVAHNIETYTTFDTPHQGANVPIGFQGFANSLINGVTEGLGKLEKAKLTLDALYSPAAIQMTLVQFPRRMDPKYFGDVYQPVNYATRSQFLQELASLGHPQKCRLLMMASGTQTGNGQNLVSSSDIFVAQGTNFCFAFDRVKERLEDELGIGPDGDFFSGILSFIALRYLGARINSEFRIRATPEPSWGSNLVSRFRIKAQLFWGLAKFDIAGVQYYFNSQPYGVSFDRLPGGNGYLYAGLFDVGIRNELKLSCDEASINSEGFAFCPTVSALDIRENVPGTFNAFDNLTIPSVRAKYTFPGTTYAPSTTVPVVRGYNGTLWGQQYNEDHVRISKGATEVLFQEFVGRFGVDKSLVGVTELRTRSYNFGAGYLGATPTTPGTTPTPTYNRITNSIAVGAGRYLGVHADDNVGFSNANPRLGYPDRTKQPSFEVLVTTLTNCGATRNTEITIESGGRLELGVFEENLQGTLRLSRGTKLILMPGSFTNVNFGSKIIVECGATLEIRAGANVSYEGSADKFFANNPADVVVEPGAIFNKSIIQPESQLVGPSTVGGTIEGTLFEVKNYGDATEFDFSESDPGIVVENTDKPWVKVIRDNCKRTDASATIRVKLLPYCGTAIVLSKTVSIINGTPMGPISTTITGPDPAYKFTRFCNDPECQSITTSENTSTYSIPAVTNVNASNGYRWTVTNGTIVSGADQNGVGTRTIGVRVDDLNVSTMTVSVYAVNPCGTTVTRSRTVTTRQWQDFTSCPGFRVCPNGGGRGARSAQAAGASASSAATIASPNPASTRVNIETLLIGDPEMPLSYQLVNSRTGQIALSGTVTHWNFNLDVGSIPRGVYTLKLNNRLAGDAIRISIFP
jgi:hypothetical protein